MKYLYLILLFFLLLSVQYSCDSHQSVSASEEDEVEISVSPAGGRGALAVSDSSIGVFRILAFDHNRNKECHYSRYYGYANDTVFSFKIAKGTYDFVFIANEVSDEATSVKLHAFDNQNPGKTLDDLKEISFPYSAFAANKHIPMSSIVRNIEVVDTKSIIKHSAPNHFSKQSIGPDTIIRARMERLGTRIDVELKTKLLDKVVDPFNGIKFTQVPQSIPLLPLLEDGSIHYNVAVSGDYADDTTADYPFTYAQAEGDQPTWSTSTEQENGVDITMYTWKKTRIILPSSMFTPENNKSKAIIMQLDITGKTSDEVAIGIKTPVTSEIDLTEFEPSYYGYSPSDFVTFGQPPYYYILPRNTRISFFGNIIEGKLETLLKVRNWTDVEIGGNPMPLN